MGDEATRCEFCNDIVEQPDPLRHVSANAIVLHVFTPIGWTPTETLTVLCHACAGQIGLQKRPTKEE